MPWPEGPIPEPKIWIPPDVDGVSTTEPETESEEVEAEESQPSC